ncbi:MAG: hypothetical protein AAGC55_27065, partial [Myxococcota bacterium]
VSGRSPQPSTATTTAVPDYKRVTVAKFRTARELQLFNLLDRRNLEELVRRIDTEFARLVATPLGRWLRAGTWMPPTSGLVIGDALDPASGPGQLYDHQQVIRAGIRNRVANGQPTGLSRREMSHLRQELAALGWAESDIVYAVRQQNLTRAYATLDAITAVLQERAVVRLATGFDMSWSEQRRLLGQARIARRGLAKVHSFTGDDTRSGEITNWPGGHRSNEIVFEIATPIRGGTIEQDTFGHRAQDINRVRSTPGDRRLAKIIHKYVGVDGYYAPSSPSLWGPKRKADIEVVLFDPQSSVTFRECANPAAERLPPEILTGMVDDWLADRTGRRWW